MEILKSTDIRFLDRYTIEAKNIESSALMERAAIAFSNWFKENSDRKSKLKVFAGLGNNGGDALAVARLLLGFYDLEVYVLRSSPRTSKDFEINYKRLENQIQIKDITQNTDIPYICEADIVIDGILGSGLKGKVRGLVAEVIKAINRSKSKVVAIDIPSGLHSENEPALDQTILEADYTICFEYPKLAFMFDSNKKYLGEWVLVKIGLSKVGLKHLNISHSILDFNYVVGLLKKRAADTTKIDYGHALLIAGSYGMLGAAILAARATLRAGVGLLTLHIPKIGYQVLQTAVPEAMCLTDEHDHYWTTLPKRMDYTVLGIGPGLGTNPQTAQVLIETLKQFDKPVVLDADALNLLANYRKGLEFIPPNSIITPHKREFARLAGLQNPTPYRELEVALSLAQEWKVYIVLKNTRTAIISPNGTVHFNSTGNPGLATGGSGDVLTGILTGLLAQSYKPLNAALLGVYLHGLTGDIVQNQTHENSLIATDLVDNIYRAFIKLSNSS